MHIKKLFFLVFFVQQGFSVHFSEGDSEVRQLNNTQHVSLEENCQKIKTVLSIKDKKKVQDLLKQIDWSKFWKKFNSNPSQEMIVYIISAIFDKNNHQDLAESALKKLIENFSDDHLILYTKAFLSKKNQEESLKNVNKRHTRRALPVNSSNILSSELAHNAFNALDLNRFHNAFNALDLNRFNQLGSNSRKKFWLTSSVPPSSLLSCILSSDNDPELAKEAFDAIVLKKLNGDNFLNRSNFNVMEIILDPKNDQNLCEKALDALEFKKFSHTKFLHTLIQILSNQDNLKFSEKALNILDLKERGNQLSDVAFCEILDPILSPQNQFSLTKKALDDLEFQKRVSELSYKNFCQVIYDVLSPTNSYEISEKALNDLNLKERASKLSDENFCALINQILFQFNNPQLAERALNDLCLKERASKLSDENFFNLQHKVSFLQDGFRNFQLAEKVLNDLDFKKRESQLSDKNFN
ncbi:hypothetical protein P618_200839 [Holospora obtusa F1]|uniref:Uncharacterized protein n=1 Tax=Holospora obtusa F1 TaxID=1399147 RepID=W6TDT0_HOLOB|nr:hypothetical protein [Holospora obtusa]ETZ06941.1 hypothetical protein P618_200839 [Holospora obtusa F1]